MNKLLIIEDDLDLALTLRNQFISNKYHVQIVSDGRKGWMYALRNKLDAIILDQNLPNMYGSEIIKRLRRAGIEVPILVLTGNTDSQTLIEALSQGADDFLVKPFRMFELESRINRFIVRPPVSRVPISQIGEIYYQHENKYVELNIDGINMSKRECELFSYLLLHRNNLVSRDSLQSNVWPDKPDLKLNTIDCYVSSLRKKLKDNADSVKISTIHGFGYKLLV